MIPPMMPSATPSALRQVQWRHQLPLILAPPRGGFGPPGPPVRARRPRRPGGRETRAGPGARGRCSPGRQVRPERAVRPEHPGPSSAGRPAGCYSSARGCRRGRSLAAGPCARRCPAGRFRGCPDSRPSGCGSPACPSRWRRNPGRSRPCRLWHRDRFRRSPRHRGPRWRSSRPPRCPRRGPRGRRDTERQSHQLCCSSVLAGGSEAAACGEKRPLPRGGSGHPGTRRTNTLPPG